jgi:hypothetical protein
MPSCRPLISQTGMCGGHLLLLDQPAQELACPTVGVRGSLWGWPKCQTVNFCKLASLSNSVAGIMRLGGIGCHGFDAVSFSVLCIAQCECGNNESGISERESPPPSIHLRVLSAVLSINCAALEKSQGEMARGHKLGTIEISTLPASSFRSRTV